MYVTKAPSETSAICLKCRVAARAFSTSRARRQFGPEHPRYIDVPEPPQQASKPLKEVKGILPVPRPLFEGKRGVPAVRRASVQLSTKERTAAPRYEADSFLEWKSKVSAQRRQNLAAGTKELRRRYDRMVSDRAEQSERRIRTNKQAALRPEREDERLTAESNNFNLKDLMRGKIQNGDSALEFEKSQKNYTTRQDEKRRIREDHLHTLYTKARSFIITSEQLDTAIEETFGTDEKPVLFGQDRTRSEAWSIWNEGVPDTVNDLLNRAQGKPPSKRERLFAPKKTNPADERMKKVVEAVTGGALGE